MRSAILGLALLAGCLTAPLVRAQDTRAQDTRAQHTPPSPPPSCEVPAYLLSSDSTLTHVADAIKSSNPLNVLVVGSRSSTIVSSEGSAYPAKLQAMLKEKLPAVPVTLSVELQTGKTADFGHLADRNRRCYAIRRSR
jgi:hypothetical protein